MVDEQVGETKDGTGSGDHDGQYIFGNPSAYLKIMDRARLLIMRGYIKDALAGEKGGAADGDLGNLPVIEEIVLAPSD